MKFLNGRLIITSVCHETYLDSSHWNVRSFFPFSNRFWRNRRFFPMFSLTFFKIRQLFSFCSRRCKKPRALRQPKEFEEKVKRQFSRQEKSRKNIKKEKISEFLSGTKIAISKFFSNSWKKKWIFFSFQCSGFYIVFWKLVLVF